MVANTVCSLPQIGTKITENKRLLKQHDSYKKEHTELQEEVERRQNDTTRLQTELEAARQAVRDQQGELQALQADKHALEAELERVKRELVDNADRNPVLLEQIQVSGLVSAKTECDYLNGWIKKW